MLLSFGGSASAQTREKTILLIRHAEKADAADNDPELSPAGRERAARLIKAIGRFRPGAFYATKFRRTSETLAPLAAKRGKQIEVYDPAKPQELLDRIVSGKTKRSVVAGHSNSIPGLANLITKKEIFKDLDDDEFAVIWLIKLKDGKARKLQILDY